MYVKVNMKTYTILRGLGIAIAVAGVLFVGKSAFAAEGLDNKHLDVACVQNAIDVRDNAVITAVDKYHTAISAALVARRDSSKAAVALTDKTARRNALKAVVENFKNSRRSAAATLSTTKKAAWATFVSSRRACGLSASEDKSSLGLDSSI